MHSERIRIEIGGSEAEDLYPAIVGLEVELDDELAAMFRLRLAMELGTDGAWSLVDDDLMKPWERVRIMAGFDGVLEDLIDGVITHLRPDFAPDPTRCTLEVWGTDRSVLLDRADVRKDWPNKRDSDIATEIFRHHGLNPEVEDTQVSHEETVSTVIQRETDIQLLTRLALRNGFECYVEGSTGHFHAPPINGVPQPVLAAHFGDNTTLRQFSVEVEATSPAEVTVTQLDRSTKDVVDVSAATSTQPTLGSTRAAMLLTAGIPAGRVVLAQAPATGRAELAALCQSVHDQGEWFVSGSGEVLANGYGHVLRPRRLVTIKGLGRNHSGVYYVTHVTHRFTAEGYTQHFRVKRNGLKPTGAEQFTGSNGLLGGPL